MADTDVKYDQTIGCESNTELNGEGSSFRNANMISAPKTILKRRIRVALVPIGIVE